MIHFCEVNEKCQKSWQLRQGKANSFSVQLKENKLFLMSYYDIDSQLSMESTINGVLMGAPDPRSQLIFIPNPSPS